METIIHIIDKEILCGKQDGNKVIKIRIGIVDSFNSTFHVLCKECQRRYNILKDIKANKYGSNIESIS